MALFDITKLNVAVHRLLEQTENPRHRYMLQAYDRHRLLEVSGRYEEIFAPQMTVEQPVYHFHALGLSTTVAGREEVEGLYAEWARTGQCVMFVEDEQLAVCDTFIASVIPVGYQQMPGAVLRALGFDVDDEAATYVYKASEQMIWPYDDRGRLIGEDVWEVEPEKAEIIKLDPADVITTAQAAELLAPLIEPLPSFEEAVVQAAAPQPRTPQVAAGTARR
jgi:hypothetical protein